MNLTDLKFIYSQKAYQIWINTLCISSCFPCKLFLFEFGNCRNFKQLSQYVNFLINYFFSAETIEGRNLYQEIRYSNFSWRYLGKYFYGLLKKYELHLNQILLSQAETIITTEFTLQVKAKYFLPNDSSFKSKWTFLHSGSFSMKQIINFWKWQKWTQ